MPTHFRASLFQGPGEPFRVERFPLPPLGSGEVLVKVSCCTICGSDYHSILGRRPTPAPSILGHEAVGVVELVGPGGLAAPGRPIEPGDRVVWGLVASCGQCRACLRGIPQKCERLFKYGHERFSAGDAPSGGFSDFCVLRPGTPILPVPLSIPDAVAATIGCAGATVAAAVRLAALREGDSVLILGAGMLGLVAAAMARCAGASVVVVADPDAERAARALRFGATHTFSGAGGQTLAEFARNSAGPHGFDVAFEFSGTPGAFQDALSCLGIAGRLVLAGAVYPAAPAAVSAEQIVRRLLRIEGVHNYTPGDLEKAVAFFASPAAQAYPFAEEIRGPFPLEGVNEAIDCGLSERPVRVAVAPSAA